MEFQSRQDRRDAFALDTIKLIFSELGMPLSRDLPTIPRELQASVLQFIYHGNITRFRIGSTPLRHLLPARYREIVGPAGDPDNDRALLSLLEKCLPDYILCNICKRLHTVDSAYLKGKHRNFACRKKDIEGYSDVFIYPSFRYPVFQLAMKQAREGMSYKKCLEILSYKNIIRSDSYTHQCVATPRIVKGYLLVRVQHIVVVPPGQTLFPADAKVTICPHYDALDVDRGTYDRGTFEAVPAKSRLIECMNMYSQSRHREVCMTCSRLLMCGYCRTEVQVDVKKCGENVVFVVTKWQDLGKGMDADDIVYRTHLYSPQANPLGLGFDHLRSYQMPRPEAEQALLRETRASETEELREAYPNSTVGSIRSAFGGGKDFISDSLAKIPKPGELIKKHYKSILKMKNTLELFRRKDKSSRKRDRSNGGSSSQVENHGAKDRGRPPAYQE